MTPNVVQGKSQQAVGPCYALDFRRPTLRHLAVDEGKHEVLVR